MSENATPRLGITALLGISALLGGLLVWSYLQGSKTEESIQPLATEQATLLPELRSLKPFSLSNHHGETFDNQSLLGQWTFMSFGYTYCPDICPTTMSLFSEMNDLLKREQQTDPYKITFVSVDPQRDSLERLAEYVTYFNPEFLGATGPEPALEKLTKPLGILYQRVETEDSAMGYVMDHSASIILVDPQGQYHAYFSPPHDPQKMANDFLSITDHARLGK
ncbi:MAG: SCO family protein [Candidatus Thiodiazotropha lotti]|uniref:Thioredoxin domain-containing protein n=1 Tax=Candidatus Thiodiazotropha endoloripes TaxID=1818881 RepID=A0A1E2US38_9GAMM|nr:SCO family protein [Candidatus Thiodiazotropha endoloripes]MCG7897007.1 SCO family protein [Candidatus Thiodiazotropha weberae]MCG7990448.1 SCO family protein [Candidatus Thiodiazotropha lotti]MCG7901680.1 SCO family protein [Candidatus Thiodiazotropha weberae]MCG7913915.1 SCO family protein [Candidatus Thiodiazotropha weberae]MCG7999825.1 SCO family protein [Candidatus Thiodiazotropha lotti]